MKPYQPIGAIASWLTFGNLRRTLFADLVKLLKGKAHKGLYRKVSGRYRIIFEPMHATHTVQVLAVLLRNEGTYK